MDERIKVPAGHPAFFPFLQASIFPTLAVVDLREAVLAAVESGDEEATRKTVDALRRQLYLGATHNGKRQDCRSRRRWTT